LVSNVAFSFYAWAIEHFKDSDHVALITRSPLSDSFIECSGWGRPLSSSTPMPTAPLMLDFKIKMSFCMSGDDILLDGSNRMVHEVACELIMTWLNSGSTHVGFLLRISNT
jgi:hypothetical protein